MKISCLYFDGVHAKEYKYQLNLGLGNITLVDPESGQKKVFWELEDIKIVQEPTHGTPGKITNVNTPEARLVVLNLEDWERLMKLLPSTAKPKSLVSVRWSAMPLYLVLSVVFFVVLYKGVPILMENTVIFVPRSVERNMGDAILADLLESTGECTTPEGDKALQKMVNTIKQHPALKDIDLVVSVADVDIENAFAFPGRSIVVFRKLIENSETPEELAFVIAHETGHIRHRHAMKGYMQGQGLSFLVKIMTGNFSMSGSGVSNVLSNFGNLHNSRDKENQADAFALEVAATINMDHREGAKFFEGIKDEDSSVIPEWLSTHPNTKERIKNIMAFHAGEKKTYDPILSTKEWKALKSICLYRDKLEDEPSSDTKKDPRKEK